MIRLDLSAGPQWLDLGSGLRLAVLPVTTAVMVAARNDPAVEALSDAASKEELALAMAHALRRDVGTAAKVALIEAGDEIAGRNPETTKRLRAALAGYGVDVHTGAEVTGVTAEGVTLAGGIIDKGSFEGVCQCMTQDRCFARAQIPGIHTR